LVTEYRRRAEEIERLAVHLIETAARNDTTAVSTFISRLKIFKAQNLAALRSLFALADLVIE
jgi:hypothetical protein